MILAAAAAAAAEFAINMLSMDFIPMPLVGDTFTNIPVSRNKMTARRILAVSRRLVDDTNFVYTDGPDG